MILSRENYDQRNRAVNGMLFERIIAFKYLGGVKLSAEKFNKDLTRSYLTDVSSP